MEGITMERNRKRKLSHKLVTENKKEKCFSDINKTKQLNKRVSEGEENVKLLLSQLFLESIIKVSTLSVFSVLPRLWGGSEMEEFWWDVMQLL